MLWKFSAKNLEALKNEKKNFFFKLVFMTPMTNLNCHILQYCQPFFKISSDSLYVVYSRQYYRLYSRQHTTICLICVSTSGTHKLTKRHQESWDRSREPSLVWPFASSSMCRSTSHISHIWAMVINSNFEKKRVYLLFHLFTETRTWIK